MSSSQKLKATIILCLFLSPTAKSSQSYGQNTRADDHAPNMIMGDHTHEAGEIMLSYRYSYMNMKGNKVNSSSISMGEIISNESNRFFGLPGQPPNLRVVPTEMSMEMHMFGLMYAPHDYLTIMAMSNYTKRKMTHTTFAGGAGTDIAGEFETRSSGLGDLKLTALFNVLKGRNKIILGAGFNFPTASTNSKDVILAPNRGRPKVLLPYAMQNGSGTFDFMHLLTYSGRKNKISWGAQWATTLRLHKSNNYKLGNEHKFSSWLSYLLTQNISASGRVAVNHMGKIKGINPNIALPVQSADPNNYGGQKVDIIFGLNLIPSDIGKKFRINLEAGLPILQDLNGPQLKCNFSFNFGVQYAF